jgi:23S rRNA (adenine2030-N6)-methyltransferase
MNYRHAYHAGNFADVIKHALLCQVLSHFHKKPTPFRVLDTHAGIGLYDLTADAAARTGEWQGGIGRLITTPPGGALGAFLAPYLESVRRLNPEGGVRFYPGSPVLIADQLRRFDQALACELHPEDHAALVETMAARKSVRVYPLDGYGALRSFLPFPERRGAVIIDPPFEATDEFDRLAEGLFAALERAATVTYLAWYPLKDLKAVDRFHDRLARSGTRKILVVETAMAALGSLPGLTAAGLVVINPPWPLADELAAHLPALARLLAQGPGGGARVEWLVGE